jgi:hypothetical protein
MLRFLKYQFTQNKKGSLYLSILQLLACKSVYETQCAVSRNRNREFPFKSKDILILLFSWVL